MNLTECLNLKVTILLCIAILAGCTSDQKQENDTRSKGNANENQPEVVVKKDKKGLEAYYELPEIKEFYEYQEMSYTEPDSLNYPYDLSSKSYDELRLLRNKIFARNGYLFNDGFLRGYFNQYDWYMPIFEVDSFEVAISEREQKLVQRILKEEKERRKDSLVKRNGYDLHNYDLAVNKKQFDQIPKKVESDLKQRNFSLIDAKRSMPFYVYDKNAYRYIPHYITTDLYLFILHKFFGKFLERYDQKYMYPKFITLLEKIHHKTRNLLDQTNNKEESKALKWVQTYTAIALTAGGKNQVEVPREYQSVYQSEKKAIKAQEGKPAFIKNQLVDYRELKPRGHYTKNDTLKNYFKAFKWVSLNGIGLEERKGLKGFVAMAHLIKNNPALRKTFRAYTASMEKLAGWEDNLSLSNVIENLPKGEMNVSDTAIEQLSKTLDTIEKQQIKPVYGKMVRESQKKNKAVYFWSATYSVSGEVFSNLVHVNLDKSKRPFPRGLDVPAALGNKTARKIILEEYNDDEAWEAYKPRLSKLKDQFKDFGRWNHNYGVRALKTAFNATAEDKTYPALIKTDAYDRKELSTMLASWTHIKHDLILYQEKPYAAQAGGTNLGPGPPQHYSYVEPNMAFWEDALQLVNWLQTLTEQMPGTSSELKRIEHIGRKLKKAAQKQINGKTLAKETHNELRMIGGKIEHILLDLLGTDHLPDREKSMALIADVYQYNGVNLNVATGHADDIYTLVPINGELRIARGAVFSYYEFRDPKIFNDQEWQKLVKDSKTPDRPDWIAPYVQKTAVPEGITQYRYPGHGFP